VFQTNLKSKILREDFSVIVDSSYSDLDKIVNSEVMITGASGFVGSWLVGSWLWARESLKGKGRLLLVCRNIEGLTQQYASSISAGHLILHASDVRSLNFPSSFKPRLVIHAATPARESLNVSNPLEMLNIIIDGQKRLLEISQQGGVERFLFLSSGAVYGTIPLNLKQVHEDYSGAPQLNNTSMAYHEGKRVAELMGNICSQNGSMGFVSARLFAFLAPFLPIDEHFAAGNFIGNAIRNEDIIIKSGGGSIRSYQYGTDLATWLWALLVRGKSGDAYNVGSDESLSIKELAEKVAEISASGISVKIMGKDEVTNISQYVPSVKKMRQEFKLDNQIRLQQSIIRSISRLNESDNDK
jgi:nucleoside-diphosphate-sugar epimerase